MDDGTLLTIGELARRTGLTVKAVRYYSDTGLVPPADRTPAGYRLYGAEALSRLELICTLRELDVGLTIVRRVLERELTVSEVAAAHADALDVQIRVLGLRRAVLRTASERGSTPEEMRLVHRLAQFTDAQRRRLIDDFINEAFGDLDANPEFVAMMRAAMPQLPDDPSPGQIEAWVELAELVQDTDFRAAVRRAAEHQAAERAEGDTTGLHHDLSMTVREEVERALAAGVPPESPEAEQITEALAARYRDVFSRPDDENLRPWLLGRLEVANDPGMERY